MVRHEAPFRRINLIPSQIVFVLTPNTLCLEKKHQIPMLLSLFDMMGSGTDYYLACTRSLTVNYMEVYRLRKKQTKWNCNQKLLLQNMSIA
jgi:hypothetical protein